MIKWPWENVQDSESVGRLASALEENNKMMQELREDLCRIADANIDALGAMKTDIDSLHKKSLDIEDGLSKTAEGMNHMWYFINGDSSLSNSSQPGFLSRAKMWCRDFISAHHLLIVSWLMFVGTVIGAVYIFLSNTGAM